MNLSAPTISKYLEHLTDSFLINKSIRYNIKGRKYIVDCDAKTDGRRSTSPMRGRIHNFNGQYNGAVRNHNIDMYWYHDCDNRRSNIFSTAAERDAEMARKQAELNAAAGIK